MCRTCGCDSPDDHEHPHDHAHDHPHDHVRPRVSLEAGLLAKNDRLARELRARLARTGITAFNLIGAPGAGKTALLERTIELLRGTPLGVIEGDQATDRDAKRIAATGCPVFQVNTGTGCHLDARMIQHALDHLQPPPRTMVFIENVGNLVCPALFDLGERAKVVVMSVTEGEDKPLKYPHVFRAASALVLAKSDLVPHLEIDPERFFENARRINPRLAMFTVSARRRDGLVAWCAWLKSHLEPAA